MGLYNDVKHVAPTSSWNDRTLHRLKRALSILEKQRMNPEVAYGKAVVMPGCPNTEIEELLLQGFNPRDIFAIESEQAFADNLYDHYWDQINVHWEEIGVWLERARNNYSYMHLDYCGHLKERELRGIEQAYARLNLTSHLRISTLLSRRSSAQINRERMIVNRVFGPIVQELTNSYPNYEWTSWYQSIQENFKDTTLAIAAVVIINAVFGLNWYTYTDTCVERGSFLPQFNGRHIITDITRFSYSEDYNGQLMSTIWFDFQPTLEGPSKDYLSVEGLAKSLYTLSQPTTLYANPSLYQ